MTSATSQELTAASRELFQNLAEDACNWGGTPMLDISFEARGNLTDLKKRGLLTTFCDDGCTWVSFTSEGRKQAKELFGVEID